MPYKGVEEDQENLIEFARGGRPTNVTTLNPKIEPTEKDDMLEVLEGLAADIRSGKVSPSHLIIGFGEDLSDGAFAYSWDAIGLNRFEVMGFLQVYTHKLASGESD